MGWYNGSLIVVVFLTKTQLDDTYKYNHIKTKKLIDGEFWRIVNFKNNKTLHNRVHVAYVGFTEFHVTLVVKYVKWDVLLYWIEH